MAGLRRLLSLALISLASAAASNNGWSWPENEQRLVEHYSQIKDWRAHSARFNVSAACKKKHRLRWAYFTRHSGTLWDWIAVADNLDISWTVIQTRNWWEMVDHRVAIDTYINTGPIANAKWRGMGQLMCHMADVLVFSDVIPDSRSVLLGNCTTPILLLMTNRIDVAVADKKNYYKFMNEVVQRPYVWFVVNNPYEAAYAGSKGVILPPERTQLLRPVGVTLLEKPPPEAAAARSKLVALIEHPGKPLLEITFIQPWLKERNLMEYVQVYGKIYGGPVVLSQHKAVISIPYQASVMKMYEGMVQGTVFAVPTPRFFKELVMDTYNGTMMEFCCRAWVKDHPEDWMEVVDWYHKDFIDGHAMFDSWDELEQLIKGEGKYTPEFLADKKATSKRLMLASRKVSLDGYRDLVEKMERQSCESLHRADMWPPPYANAWKRPERGW